jgi:glutathione synthase/RimK-type ligase-like ATP-grasp enzyme
MSRLESIANSPVILQDYVEGIDVRAIWIGGRLLSVAIDARTGSSPEDCRYDQTAVCSPHELPDALQEQLSLLMSLLGLQYGAIDLRLGVDGGYRFFEVNPSGQFAYLEARTGVPITAAMAALLWASTEKGGAGVGTLGPDAPRVSI